jgi:hypothetical protein
MLQGSHLLLSISRLFAAAAAPACFALLLLQPTQLLLGCLWLLGVVC